LITADYLVAVVVYVLYRSPQPDEESVKRVQKELKKNNIGECQFVEFKDKHCTQVESSAENGSCE
jgi:hypothetical protein